MASGRATVPARDIEIQEGPALMDGQTERTFEFDGQLYSVEFTKMGTEIDVRVYNSIGLALSVTFDPRKQFSQQGKQRWPMQEKEPLSISRPERLPVQLDPL